MTRDPQCAEMRRALGVYVVGAIAPADRSAVDRHLSSCADCRAELAGLAGLPALLGRVPDAEATRLLLGGSQEVLPQPPLHWLLGRAARSRRRRLWPGLAVAAAAGLMVGGGAVTASRLLDSPQAQPHAAAAQQRIPAVRGSDPHTHASAVVRYRPQPWGLQLAVQVSGIPPGTRCELHVTSASGQDVITGSWTVISGHQGAWYPGSSSDPLSDVRSFIITAGARTLVTVPFR
jgi:anti-sigma factor RsiW